MSGLRINRKIESFKASVELLIENHDKNKYSKELLRELYDVIAQALNHIGIENIDLIYTIFCENFPEYADDISLDYFKSFLIKINDPDLSEDNKIIYINKSSNISTLDNYDYFFFKEENHYGICIEDDNTRERFDELTDEQWACIVDLFNDKNLKGSIFKKTKLGYRNIINGIFWIIINNRKWRDMPKKFPSYPTCNKYYNNWKKTGFIQIIINKLTKLFDQKDIEIIHKNINYK